MEIDGTTQTDTNPNGPDVELIGSSLSSGSGLDFRAERMGVRGLSIVGFPDNGVFYLPPVRESVFKIENNFIGVTPDGEHTLGHGSRGIVIIRDNVIGGNARSGIFIVTQPEPGFPLSPVIRVTGNRIGVAASSDAPLGNGASGIFVGPRTEQVLIGDNVIAHNRHFGVAIAAGARWVPPRPTATPDVALERLEPRGPIAATTPESPPPHHFRAPLRPLPATTAPSRTTQLRCRLLIAGVPNLGRGPAARLPG